jgi:hypothetical protein
MFDGGTLINMLLCTVLHSSTCWSSTQSWLKLEQQQQGLVTSPHKLSLGLL